ncbi:MAG TPA: sugar transferase [Candidatus Methylomirabilis sp.]|nr:sugar transferase [Candidatus Methylomirabilis sp.]
MLGKRRVAWVLRLLLTDASALALFFVVAYELRVLLDVPLNRPAAPLPHYLWLLAPIIVVWVVLLASFGAYGVRWTVRSRVWLSLRVNAIGFVLLTAALFLVRESEINRSMLALFAVVGGVGLWAERGLVRAWLRRAGHLERWARVALVVGTGERAARVISALHQYPEAGWVVRGRLRLDASDLSGDREAVPVLGTVAELQMILNREHVVDEVFFAVPPTRLDEIADALEICESLGVDTRVLVDIYRPAQAHPFVEELFTLPFYGFSPTLTRQSVLAAKRILDVVGAFMLVVALSPLLLVIGLLVTLTSSGPVIFRQERAGFHGRRFWMYKFRTMIAGAEHLRAQLEHLNEMSGPVFKVTHDPRLTRVGRVLRKLSLDELPQLLNVLKGDMSLVGPRPLPVYEASQIKGEQRRRLAMRPGITGLWQVSGRNAVDFEGWMQMDLFYVDRWSLGLDLRILLRTIPVVLRGAGAS